MTEREYFYVVTPFVDIEVPAEAWYSTEGYFGLTIGISSTGAIEDSKELAVLEYLGSPEFEEDLTDEILEIHERYGELMLAMIESNCPVDTGELADSFSFSVDEDGVSIESDCEHYPFVEARYHMVGDAYAFYEPLMLSEIDALVASKLGAEE